ncbi:MAG: uroporphyrinogen-III synthase [Porticoccaceae bacterium]|jgi:uroporphyrinogen-III synthase|nr:uroporphyrinogen-III synthase [Porticoccaceae bacterium]
MAFNRLSGKRLLVIRSRRDHDEFLQLVSEAHAKVVHIPVIDIEPTIESSKVTEQILSFDEFDIAIFVSVHAGQIAMQRLDEYWPMLPTKIDYFAIGRQTASFMKSYVHKVQCPGTKASSEGLLEMSALQDIKNKSVVIFRGGTGRELLGQELNARGARVEYCDIYRRVRNNEKLQLAYQQLAETDFLIAHSGELLEAMGPLKNLEHFVKGNLFSVLVPSQRVAEIAYNLGYGSVLVAENALPELMVKALQQNIETSNLSK